MSKDNFFALNKHSIPCAAWMSVYFEQFVICVHNALFWCLGNCVYWESDCYVKSLIFVYFTTIILRYVFLNCLFLDVTWHLITDHFPVNISWTDKMPAKDSKTKNNFKTENTVTKWQKESDDKTKDYLLLTNAKIGIFLILINQKKHRRIIFPDNFLVKY